MSVWSPSCQQMCACTGHKCAAALSKVLSVSIERAYYMCCSQCSSHGIIGVTLQLMYTIQEVHEDNSVQAAETRAGDCASLSTFYLLVSAEVQARQALHDMSSSC